MIKSQVFQLLALCALFSFAACHEHDEDDTTNPVINISSPTADASLSGAVAIKGTVTDESLHEMSIVVTKDSDGSELFKKTPEVHDLTSYTINESWTPSGIGAETSVTLKVTVSDHSDHTVEQIIKFKVKP